MTPQDAATRLAQDSALSALSLVHADTDRRFAATTRVLTDATGVTIGCRAGCASCCTDGLSVWSVEADAISAWVNQRTERGLPPIEPHAPGACAFLDAADRCQVFDARPYVCRSQGAVLGWSERDDDGVEATHRATCSVHLDGVDLDALPEPAVFALGPAEARLLAIATESLAIAGRKGLPQRVPLRRLAQKLARRR